MAFRVQNFSEPEPRGLLQPVCRHICFKVCGLDKDNYAPSTLAVKIYLGVKFLIVFYISKNHRENCKQ